MDAHPLDPPETLFETRWLRVCRRGKWDYVERAHGNGHAVVIVAATPDDRVLFVEQVRAAVGHRTIELPAGLVGDESANDTPEAAAVRELVE
jgi:ADP-ribose pyrophosphatase